MPTLSRRFPTRTFLTLAVLCLFAGANAGQPVISQTFESFLASRFAKTDPEWKLDAFCPISTDVVAARVLREYGAVFAAADTVTLPMVCIYSGEDEVLKFQKRIPTSAIDITGVRVTLQAKAAESLQKAASEAAGIGLTLTPYDGPIAGSRSYGDSLKLWNGRFFSALDYWTKNGRLTEEDRSTVAGADLRRRIEIILKWESQGIFFSTDRTRSIFSSTAPPGSSQHLSMLAFDVAEYGRPQIRDILQRHGWYQTIVGDPLHFTFLGVQENALPARGLRLVERGSNRYWVPNLVTVTR